MKVISIGDLVTDFYYKNGKLIGVNGGMTSHNIIANMCSLGWNTEVFGVCGNDSAGHLAIESLKDLGIDVNHVKVLDDINTRCFHVSYIEKDGTLTFSSKKRCPFCGEKRWYANSKIDINDILENIEKDDILVFDNLNVQNQLIIDNTENKKMLDLGQYFELEDYNNQEVINKIQNKFDIINLNERVEKYLKERFSIDTDEELYYLLHTKMIIITRGNRGSDFVYEKGKITKKLTNPETEVDASGAGDGFFSVFISEYIKKHYKIDQTFIDDSFIKATKLTKKVVKKMGARGHIKGLYKIKKVDDTCTCKCFEMIKRKQIKRCNININHLETRIINAINSGAYQKLVNTNFQDGCNYLFIGTGGSYAGAKFSAKVINYLYGFNAFAFYPRDVYYRNNKYIDKIFLFTYSGTTNDVYMSVSSYKKNKIFIITKGEIQKVVTTTKIPKENIISYRTGTNKGKERGFLSFEGTISPASLFLKLYFEENNLKDIETFIKECNSYWKEYFKEYFIKNKKMLKDFFINGSLLHIFSGDYTDAASSDLESKIIESGIFTCLIHEKKNFSHGRFINYEHLNDYKTIYFKQKTVSTYEKELLDYLSNGHNLIIESRYDGILCEYDLLIASQYLIYSISNFLNVDISKPTYSENAMKIYYYKGKL